MLTLVSTVVAPAFVDGTLTVRQIDEFELFGLLKQVTDNLHGHAATVAVLRELHQGLPEARRGFWDGATWALAVRPRGGVRGAGATGDTAVTLTDLEYVLIKWQPAVLQ